MAQVMERQIGKTRGEQAIPSGKKEKLRFFGLFHTKSQSWARDVAASRLFGSF